MSQSELPCRAQLPGIHREGDWIAFEFGCETAAGIEQTHRIDAFRGETIAAALIAAGHWETRRSHLCDGTKRAGVTCGMGVCSECIVLVNGARRRACMEPAAPGLQVRQHPSHAPVSGGVPDEQPRTELTLEPDVLIVGAGPAGLSAACAAAGAGLDVVVVDERRAAGGQFFKQPHSGFRIDGAHVDAQFRRGRKLIDTAIRSGARFFFQATVWGAFAPHELRATTPEQSLTIRPQRLIIATGAYEIAVPFPGWDLPGVMTTGAAQTLLRGSLVTPGRHVLVAGNGPLNLQVASELADAGTKIAAVAEAASPPNLHNVGCMALASPALAWSGIKHVLRLRKHGLKVAYGHALTRVEALASRELAATTNKIDDDGHPIGGTETTYVVDAICTGYGFQSQTEIARALGCTHSYDTRRGALTVNRDAECRTSVREVFVVGDAGSLGGAHIAMAQGALAGAAVARDLGKPLNAAGEQRTRAARPRLSRHTKFQAALWSMYAAPLLQRGQLAAPDTQVCRCEGLTKRDLLTYAEQGMSLAAIKRRSRAAMGGCQGRYCTPVITEILRHATKASIGEGDIYAPRPPFRPTTAAQIASLDLQQEG